MHFLRARSTTYITDDRDKPLDFCLSGANRNDSMMIAVRFDTFSHRQRLRCQPMPTRVRARVMLSCITREWTESRGGLTSTDGS